MKKLLLASVGLCFATAAQATIVPVLVSVTPTGSNFLFTYNATLSADQGLTDGSKFVIFDFAGYLPGSVSGPPGFPITASTELLSDVNTGHPGGVQANSVYTDDPTVLNLVFTYHGPDFGTTGGPFDPLTITGFSAVSSLRATGLDGFSARAIRNDGSANGVLAFNTGAVGVPVGVPEPSAWALMVLGLGGLGAALRRRSLAQAA